MADSTVTRFDTDWLILTTPFVIYGILRYFFLVQKHGKGDDPGSLLMKDKPLLLNAVLWIAAVIFIIYLYPLLK
jgi:hypothetical protein